MIQEIEKEKASRWEVEHADEDVPLAERVTDESIAYYAANPHEIDARLRELNHELDAEGAVEAQAGLMMVAGLAIGLVVNRKFFGLAGIVGAFLIKQGLTGRSTALNLLRGSGVRTKMDIQRERFALKALRGDFDSLAGIDALPPWQKAELVLEAVRREPGENP